MPEVGPSHLTELEYVTMPTCACRLLRRLVALTLSIFAAAGIAHPQSPAPSPKTASASAPPSTLRIATRIVPPLVVEQNGKLTGFSIDLWDAIGARLETKTVYDVQPDVAALLATVKESRADAGISAVSITAERYQDVDFSQPMLGAGQQILVRGDATSGSASTGPNAWRTLLGLIFSRSMLGWIIMGLIFALIPAHILWYLERHHPKGILPNREYFPGILQAMWWSIGTLLTQSEQMPRHGLARLGAILWMFTGLVFVAYYTAQLTATLTVQQIKGSINGPEDLPGKRVATLKASTSAAYLKKNRAHVVEHDQVVDAYAALQSNKVDAIVFDAPVLQHYASHDGRGRVQAVGAVFQKEDYGIVFPLGSALRKRVDATLLSLREDGTYQRIHDKWFDAK
jgi:polar amino acid transport system substrate-binding protein